MPIVITLPDQNPKVGPGLSFSWQSDFIGPLPTGSKWRVQAAVDSEFSGDIFWGSVFATDVLIGGITMLNLSGGNVGLTIQDTIAPAPGQTTYLRVQLLDASNVVQDEGFENAPFTYTDGVPFLLRDMLNVIPGSYALDAISTAVGEVKDAVTTTLQTATGAVTTTLADLFARPTLDQLTLDEVTSGETFDPVASEVVGSYFGVIVRVTTIAPELKPGTPDLEWYVNDLAVLRVFRGTDLQDRIGVHTPTRIVLAPWAFGEPFLNSALIFGAPPDTTIRVNWRIGCGGQVYLMQFP